jgi:phage-related protein (TIGR01555 family)
MAARKKVIKPKQPVVLRDDGWVNPLTGHGGEHDKTQAAFFWSSGPIPRQEIDALYEGDPIMARIVDDRVNEMFRVHPDIVIDRAATSAPDSTDEKHEAKLRAAAKELGFFTALEDAVRWARKDGGAAIFLVYADGAQMHTQVVGAPEVKALLVLDRWQVSVLENYRSSTLAEDGQNLSAIGTPRFYQVSTEDFSVKVHASRIVPFFGRLMPPRIRPRYNGWGASVLQTPYQAVKMFWGAHQSANGLLSDLSQAVFKIEGLWDALVNGNKDKIQERMRAVDRQRSSVRAIVLDTKEDFSRIPSQLAGIDGLLREVNTLLAASIDMPLTRLFGASPGGLNATGESDERHYYDSISSERGKRLTPSALRILQAIGAPMGVQKGSIDLVWHPLYEPDPKETAEIEKLEAETDATRIADGVLDPAEVRAHLVGRSWNSLIDPSEALKAIGK